GAPAHPAEAPSQRVEKRGEPKPQAERAERATQKKQPRPPREEKIRSETKLPGTEERPAAEEFSQPEDTSRRRRRGGRQRERGERLERASRENKQMAEKYPHPQPATNQLAHEEKNAEIPVPEPTPPTPVSVQETPVLVLTASAQTPEAFPESGGRSPSSRSPAIHPEPSQAHEIPPSTASAAVTPAPVMVSTTASEALETPGEAPPAHLPHLLIEETTPEESTSPSIPAAMVTAQAAVSGTEAEAIVDLMPASKHQDVQNVGQPQPSQVAEVPSLVADGLVMVETIPEKIKPGEAEAGAESTLPQRRRRRPAPTPMVAHEEPMVQIETHSK
ncbi:MAG: hypothetical protein KGM95_01740, partial [Betaproteobacteria bacterium]|nr:hypothetical protein [Betaproteobacteria bacterium]